MTTPPSTTEISTGWRILRVQAGTLQKLPFGRTTWTTAIVKQALREPVSVEHNGIVGDEHTGRGPDPERALCCCPADHYDHWRATLGLELPLGIFGENLTIAEADENNACIGDVLRCGSALVQISQPRMPCYKQARRIERPDFVKLIMKSGRLGFLMRVLEPGTLQEGDELLLLERPHPDVPVAEVVRAFRDSADREAAQRLSNMPLLANEWREKFAERVSLP
jgi:MOSC domain-containing protein YiiM